MDDTSKQMSYEQRVAALKKAGAEHLIRFVPVEMPSMKIARRMVTGIVARDSGSADAGERAIETASSRKRVR